MSGNSLGGNSGKVLLGLCGLSSYRWAKQCLEWQSGFPWWSAWGVWWNYVRIHKCMIHIKFQNSILPTIQNCQLRSTALAGAQIVLERARHLESTLDNNVLLQYLDAVLFDQYLCKGNILHHTIIVKYLNLSYESSTKVCGRMSSLLFSIPGPRRWVV